MFDEHPNHPPPRSIEDLSDDELLHRAVELEQQRCALDAAQSRVLAQIADRGVTDIIEGHHVAPWLARECRLALPGARSRVRVGRVLARVLPETLDALEAGRITWDHARAMVAATNPRIAEVVAEHQGMLTGLAQHCSFERWRAELAGLVDIWDSDGGHDPDRQRARNRLSVGIAGDEAHLRGTFVGANAATVAAAIEAMADQLYERAKADREIDPSLIVPPPATLRAEALLELLRGGLVTDAGSGKPPRVEVSLSLSADEPSEAVSDEGVRVWGADLDLLGCDADIFTLLIDSLGVPLDAGAAVRFATRSQRRALRRRDGGCVFPGCSAPQSWCDLHHAVHWASEGPTDIANLVTLCRHHHAVIHRPGWTVHLDLDGWAIITRPAGLPPLWGQRDQVRRTGPPPEPVVVPPTARTAPRPRPARYQGRHTRLEDPLQVAHDRDRALVRLATLREAA